MIQLGVWNIYVNNPIQKRENENTAHEGVATVLGGDDALLEILAHRRLRDFHKFNRGAAETRKGSSVGYVTFSLSTVFRIIPKSLLTQSNRVKERPAIASDLIQRKQRIEMVGRVDEILKGVVRDVRKCVNVRVRRRRGGGEEGGEKEGRVVANWVMMLFGR